MDVRKEKEWNLNGYFTVEASILMPFVLALLVLILYTGFFLYQRCLLTIDGYRLVFWICIENRSELPNKSQGSVDQAIRDLIGSKYSMGSKPEVLWEISRNKAIVNMNGSMTVTAGSIFGINKQWDYEAAAAAKIDNPAKILRNYRRIMEMGESMMK